MARPRIAAALILSLVGGALSLLLLSTHYGVPLMGEAALAACGAGGGCDVVSQSRYASFLGLPLAAWGLIFYGSLVALLTPPLLGRGEDTPDRGPAFAFLLVAISLVIDVVLLGLQVFVIKAFCKFCFATYAVNLLILAALWPMRSVAEGLNFLFTPQSRKGLVSWLIATLAFGAAAASANMALKDRKALASTSILGVPTSLQAPEKVAPGSVDEQVAAAREEARKWKDTLDDERKLQQYLNQKARDEFNAAPVATFDLSGSPAQGAPGGPITVVSFSDFMCPFCRDLATALRNYLPTSRNLIRSHYKHFPLEMSCNPRIGQSVHPGACELALGGICAEESGRFWEYHDKVFLERWDKATRADVLRIGAAVGLDGPKLNSCLDAAATKGRLAREVDEGWRSGVTSTPTVFIGGRKLRSTGVFPLAVEEERKRLKLPPQHSDPPPEAVETGSKKPKS